jgi:release factor glutamine methyltransferase
MVGWMQSDFAERGLESPRLDAELLVAHVLGVPRLNLYLDLDRPIGPEELATLRDLVRRRRDREPVAYLVGTKDFWKGRFRVDARVLVPRPDTETLVERAVSLLRGDVIPEGSAHVEAVAEDLEDLDADRVETNEPTEGESRLVEESYADDSAESEGEGSVAGGSSTSVSRTPGARRAPKTSAETRTKTSALPDGPVVDLCTGSGCVVVSLASEVPDRTYFATDLSPDALEVARENAQTAGVAVELTAGDLFAGLDGPFALVVANPPYVEDAEIPTLAPEVAKHEPRLALAGGPDGLDVVRRLATQAFARLLPGGALLVEVGADQGPRAAEIFRRVGFVDVRVIPDLAGRDRVIEGWRR